ncbi:hypothetical protein [Mesonia sp. HuA40]|uniref:hypothetical protein n=1 Tax=Mesonia sp. HuA40 TaxID=2602761 RepID=UPI0011CC91EF|nr:hypothetical protein [Mesonia sp. HuA40]TXK73959.1 hypothetical protein FT993_03615 [Mesonia sp. HuA40]
MVRIIKIILLILAAVVLTSCRSKKVVSEEREVVKVDTIFQEKKVVDTLIVEKVKEVTKPVYFETKIPCNENQSGKIGSGEHYTEYEIKDGELYLKTNIDSLVNSKEAYYRSKFVADSISIRKQLEEKYSSQERIKVYVYPWWVWLLGAGMLIFAVLWVRSKFLP